MNILQRLSERLFAGEQGLLRECSALLPIAREAAASIKPLEGGAPDVANVRRLEQAADDDKFRIANMIASGAVAPNVLDNMVSLLGHQDGIVNALYNLARELSRYSVPDAKEDRYIRTQVAGVLELVHSAVDTLLEMYEQVDVTKLRLLRQTIERLEETGDAIKEGMLDHAYAKSATFQSFYHTVQVAYIADNVLDGCEDSADALLTIVSSLIT
jgi:uncharacterized protein Yka (UPF0111/DUF47 family)